MQLLLATTETQGHADDDYFFASPGEIVQPPTFVCHAYPSSCGCDRVWAGLESRRACTTAVVAETDLMPHELRQQIRRSLDRGGWLQWLEPPEADAWIDRIAIDVIEVARSHDPGTILGVHWLATDNDDVDGTLPRELVVRWTPRLGVSEAMKPG